LRASDRVFPDRAGLELIPMEAMMGGIFGDSGAQAEAKAQAAQARRELQTSNEEANRSQQRAERGGRSGGGTRGRDMLIGNLSYRLKKTLGG